MEVIKTPGSTAGVKRNHKVGKCANSLWRAGITPGKVEKKVSIAHNEMQLEVLVLNRRHSFENLMRSCHIVYKKGQNPKNRNGFEEGVPCGSAMLSSEEPFDEEMIALEAAIASAGGPLDIKDHSLFVGDE